MNHHTNRVRIKAVANAFKALNEKVVFVGGATISLYTDTDRQVLEVRPTDDVDVIVEIVNYQQRSELEEKLRAAGFINDMESGVICRYRIPAIIVDVMPTEDPSIGFSNQWYPEGFRHALDFQIDENCTVKILSAPFLLPQNLRHLRIVEKMTDAPAKILRTSCMCSKTDLQFGKKCILPIKPLENTCTRSLEIC